MAVTPPAGISGPADLRRRVNEAIETAICRPIAAAVIRRDATSMRERMARELRPHGPWDVKLRPGGLIDIEFVAQVLQLIHARDAGFRRSQTTRVALRR